jgi:RHS repeat-associated protein
MYMGKDIMGSVRSVTVDTGTLEDRYEYDAFGQPYKGDLTGGMNLGYTGKPYDSATGLYNYGYRDYKPQAARFTTVDPIRDGNNWYAYVNNDPVNWVDRWGLWDEALGDAVDNHKDEKYESGKNDCDIWVEKVAKEGSITLPSTWSPAATTTVSQHAEDMKNELQNKPNLGANIIIHNNNHAMLGYLNNDGKFDIAHISSNGGVVEVTTFSSVKAFEDDWKKTIQYVPVETKPPAPAPAQPSTVTKRSSGELKPL